MIKIDVIIKFTKRNDMPGRCPAVKTNRKSTQHGDNAGVCDRDVLHNHHTSAHSIGKGLVLLRLYYF